MSTGFADWFETFGLGTALLIWLCLSISYGILKLARWARPWVEDLLREKKATEENTRETNTRLAQSFEKTYQVQEIQTPTLERVDCNVKKIGDTQENPNSMISNVHTNEKLDVLVRNSKIIAHSSIIHMRALAGLHPECKEKFDEAIELLKQIEKDG